jgi:hypothetical protein
VPPGKESPSTDNNLLVAVGLLVVAALLSAAASAFICDFVLRSFQDTNAMVMLITDAGTKSDDKNLERNLSAATMALKTCRDLGWALSVGCLGVGVAVFLRLRRQNAS